MRLIEAYNNSKRVSEQLLRDPGSAHSGERLQEGVVASIGAAALGLGAAAGGFKLGQAVGAHVGADVGRRVGEYVGRGVGKHAGALLGALVVGSLAHRVFYALLNKTGREPSKEELMAELRRQKLENDMIIERNRRTQDGFSSQGSRSSMALYDLNEKIQKQLDTLDSVRESMEEELLREGLLTRLAVGGLKLGARAVSPVTNAAGAVAKTAVKTGAKVAWKGTKELGKAAGNAAINAAKPVAQAAKNDATGLAKWAASKTVSGAKAAPGAAFSGAKKAVSVAMNPSQHLGNALAKSSSVVGGKIVRPEGKLQKLGNVLSSRSQSASSQAAIRGTVGPKLAWMADGGNKATLGQRATGFKNMVAGAAADMGLQQAAGAGIAAGAAHLASKKAAGQNQPGPANEKQPRDGDGDGKVNEGQGSEGGVKGEVDKVVKRADNKSKLRRL